MNDTTQKPQNERFCLLLTITGEKPKVYSKVTKFCADYPQFKVATVYHHLTRKKQDFQQIIDDGKVLTLYWVPYIN